MLDEKVYKQHLLSPQGHRAETGNRLPEEWRLWAVPSPSGGWKCPAAQQSALSPYDGTYLCEPWVDSALPGFWEGWHLDWISAALMAICVHGGTSMAMNSYRNWSWSDLRRSSFLPSPAWIRSNYIKLLRHLSSWVLNISEEGDPTTCLGNLLQCLTTIMVKRFFIPNWNFLFFQLVAYLKKA